VISTAYAIIKHKFLDIQVIIKKTLVFAALFTLVFGVFVGITLLIQHFIGVGANLIGFAISSLIIILTVRPIEDFLTKVTDKYLFQKKYDYKHILKSFIDEVITVLSLDTIAKSTLDLLDKTLHPETAAILLLHRLEDKYRSYQSLGSNQEIVWDNKAVIPTYLSMAKDVLSVEKSSNSVKIPEALKSEMDKYGVRLAIPLMLHDDIIGIMLLGKKKSDEDYTQDDMDILSDLARTESIAIGNAQLFSEAAQNERRAAIGTLAAGINHEIGNPLNIINTKMQVYLMSLERGLYKDKKPDEIIAEAGEIMKTCLQQTTRISDITKKLSSFAKPSKDFKPEMTDIEEQMDDTLSVVGHDLELERIEIRKKIGKPLSKILADKRQIQQILFNIIRNAGQAIKEKGVIEISASDSPDGNVKIEISDTGHGIPEDKLEKIYEPFFTTKEPGKGTGLGLSIVRQLVWRNKGDIKVRSKMGEGTTFTITFPQAK
ncbi:MAG: ATP-binding protein, partial [Candidatus Omnitrophica bacterium]|nr:ATP-binding protein [Candidatus Omnitrophota bacterium]